MKNYYIFSIPILPVNSELQTGFLFVVSNNSDLSVRFNFTKMITTMCIGLLIFLSDSKANAQCTLTGSWTMSPTSCPETEAGSLSCSGLINGTPPYVCSISPNAGIYFPDPSSGGIFVNLPANTYTITTTDANGNCGISVEIVTSSFPLMQETFVVTPATCGQSNGGSCVTITNGSGSYSYEWTAPLNPINILSTTSCLMGVAPAIYSLKVTDTTTGCIRIFQTLITDIPFSNSINVIDSECPAPNCEGTANIFLTGRAPYQINWTSGDLSAETFTSNPIPISGLCPETYSGTVSDASGCSSSFSFTIESGQPDLNVLFSTSQPICEENNGEICVYLSNNEDIYEYEWTHISSNTHIIGDACLSDIQAGEYQVLITYPATGCQWISTYTLQSTTINIDAIVNNSYCTDPYCNGSAQLTLPIAMQYTIEWIDNVLPNQIFESDQFLLNELCPGQYSGIISAYENCGANIEFAIGLDEPNENETPCLTIDINENSILDVQIWPNPFTQILQIILPEEAAFIEWLDLTGSIIHTEQVFYPKQSFNLSKFAEGNYMMRVVLQDGRNLTNRVVKQ